MIPSPPSERWHTFPTTPSFSTRSKVGEHLEFIASAYRVDDFVSPRAKPCLRSSSWWKNGESWPRTLSRGMRQKVAICCAYLHDPKAILFDEPLTGLDPYAIRTLKASIADRAASGPAVVVSSHLLVLVEDLCTHLLYPEQRPSPVLRLPRRGPLEVCRLAGRRWRRLARRRFLPGDRNAVPGREQQLMHPSLYKLLLLTAKSNVRRLFRGARTAARQAL